MGHTRPLMIFAAGFGTRMAPLTNDVPKPLLKVAGRPLIDYALDLARAAGADPIVVNVHYLAGLIRDHLRSTPDVEIADETNAILETGGGLKNALGLIGHPVAATLNSDAVWAGPNPLCDLWDAWDDERMDVLLSLIPRDQAIGHEGVGDFDMGPDGRLVRGRTWVYTGAQIVRAGRVQDIPEKVFSMNRVWDAAEADDRLFGLPFRGEWCDVGRPRSIALAEALVASNRGKAMRDLA